MKEKWNERFANNEYFYGTEPNDFLKEQIDSLPKGVALFPAEGEGRNAAYAAKQGWNVKAFDFSKSAQAKALQLADNESVVIDYSLNSLDDFPFDENQFDLIAICFLHVPEKLRIDFHTKAMKSLKKGAYFVAEYFSKAQFPNASGGPKNIDLLYETANLHEDFKNYSIELLQNKKRILNEGKGHQGEAELIQVIVRK